jgi:hypothetical protein
MNRPVRRPHCDLTVSRRDFLARAGVGFGALAWSALRSSAEETDVNPLAPRRPHFPARAKRVIWCFLDGGPSHLDLFDPKPALKKFAGQPLPPSFKRPMTSMGSTANTPLLASKRTFKQHGQSGQWISDWLPEIAACADDLAVVRSCQADGQTHVAGVLQANTGSILPGRPAVGAWSLYGLGSVSDNLPGFVVLTDSPSEPPGGPLNWGAGFMPATYQGTRFSQGKSPILFPASPPPASAPRSTSSSS